METMDRCEICGEADADLVCSRCGRNVCSGCFHSESHLCSLCTNENKTEGTSSLTGGDFRAAFSRLFPLGIVLIFAGMILTMIASFLAAPGGGIFIGVFPFFIGTVSETAALTIMVVLIVVSLAVMFLPWILGPRRILRALKRMGNLQSGDFQMEEVRKGQRGDIGDYMITLKMPGFKEDDIEVRVFNNSLTVQALKNGDTFRRTYELPRDREPRGVKYDYEDGFLIIRVSLKRKEEA